MTIRRTAPYLLLAVASLILAPVFVRGLPCSDDILPHLYRAVRFDLNLRAGAPGLPWGPDLLRGYGYPIFGFYAPLALWLIEAIHLLAADFALAVGHSKAQGRPVEIEAEIQGRREAAERLRGHRTRDLAIISLGLLALKFGVVDRVNSPIRAERLRDGELAGVGHPARVEFSGEVAYLGYSGPGRVASGSSFRVAPYWTALRPLGVPYGFSMRVADDTGRVWGEAARRPFGYTDYPGTESWPMDRYARDAFEIALRAGTPTGEYWLEASAFRRDIALALTPQGAPTGPEPSQARVGKMVVAGLYDPATGARLAEAQIGRLAIR